MSDAQTKSRRIMFGCLGLLFGVALAVGIWIWPVLMTAKKVGVFDPKLESTYEGDSMQNLKEMHQALIMYHDSEGGFPMGENWMDSALIYMKTSDLNETEVEKKLKNPAVAEKGAYGYSFNAGLEGGFIAPEGMELDDPEAVNDPDGTVLVFESGESKRNAVGDPLGLEKDEGEGGDELGVSVSGSVEALKKFIGRE